MASHPKSSPHQSPPGTNRSQKPPKSPTNNESVFDRVLPHDLDAERALLGSMLQSKEAIGDAITALQDAGHSAFFRESHQQLYDVLVSFYDRDLPIDGLVIKEELDRQGLFEKLGGFEFLTSLVNAVPHALRASYYAEIVRDRHILRELISATWRVMDAAFDTTSKPQEIIDYTEREIFGVTERRIRTASQALPDLIQETFRQIQDRGDGALTGVPTGLIELDELTCGFQPAELIIVAGRPSMGKTALGLNLAEHMAIVENRPVIFFSLEMSCQQLAQRILCCRARVDAHRLRRGRHSQEDLLRLQATADELSHAPLLVDDSSSLTILELRARARTAYRKYKIQAIFVDYLQLMRAPGSEARHLEVSAISAGLKALAKDLHVPVIAMAQLNRQVEGSQRRGNRPRMSDLRESGAIEQDADVIALLHRESYYKTPGGDGDEVDDNTAELIIAKQRNGPTDTIKLHFNRKYTRFDNHHPGDFGGGGYNEPTPYNADGPGAGPTPF
ncbi:MAG: replicative DNA helicase [Phycisphaerae bacterium]